MATTRDRQKYSYRTYRQGFKPLNYSASMVESYSDKNEIVNKHEGKCTGKKVVILFIPSMNNYCDYAGGPCPRQGHSRERSAGDLRGLKSGARAA